MIVGLPGTGIGGLFYLLMSFYMPVHELYMLCRGRSSWARWRYIALNLSLVAGILASLWATMAIFKAGLALAGVDRPQGLLEAANLGAQVARDTSAFFGAAAWASVISLGVLVALVQVLRLVVPRTKKPSV